MGTRKEKEKSKHGLCSEVSKGFILWAGALIFIWMCCILVSLVRYPVISFAASLWCYEKQCMISYIFFSTLICSHKYMSHSVCHLSGSYLIVITDRECVGSYLGHPIFRVSSLKVFPCDHSVNNSPLEQVRLCYLFSFITHSKKWLIITFKLIRQSLAEKDGGRVFWTLERCREDYWSLFFLWDQFNPEVKCFPHES